LLSSPGPRWARLPRFSRRFRPDLAAPAILRRRSPSHRPLYVSIRRRPTMPPSTGSVAPVTKLEREQMRGKKRPSRLLHEWMRVAASAHVGCVAPKTSAGVSAGGRMPGCVDGVRRNGVDTDPVLRQLERHGLRKFQTWLPCKPHTHCRAEPLGRTRCWPHSRSRPPRPPAIIWRAAACVAASMLTKLRSIMRRQLRSFCSRKGARAYAAGIVDQHIQSSKTVAPVAATVA